MATTKTEICNLALSGIGNEAVQITDFDNDTGKSARQCRLHYQPTLDELLRSHTWGCAKKRIQPVETVPIITNDDQSDDFTYYQTYLTKAQFVNAAETHSYRWTGSAWEYGTWTAPSTFSATFTNSSTDNIPPETGWVAVTSGTLTTAYDYGFDWTAAFLLPTDCIRALYFTSRDSSSRAFKWKTEWTIEGRTILTGFDTGFLLYIAEPIITTMDSLFVRAFYTLLESKLAVPVAGDRDARVAALAEFEKVILPEARRVDGFEGDEQAVIDSDWIEATYSTSGFDNFYSFTENSDGSISQ